MRESLFRDAISITAWAMVIVLPVPNGPTITNGSCSLTFFITRSMKLCCSSFKRSVLKFDVHSSETMAPGNICFEKGHTCILNFHFNVDLE